MCFCTFSFSFSLCLCFCCSTHSPIFRHLLLFVFFFLQRCHCFAFFQFVHFLFIIVFFFLPLTSFLLSILYSSYTMFFQHISAPMCSCVEVLALKLDDDRKIFAFFFLVLCIRLLFCKQFVSHECENSAKESSIVKYWRRI